MAMGTGSRGRRVQKSMGNLAVLIIAVEKE